MKQRRCVLFALLCIVAQACLAWDGSGTQTDPFKITNSTDWKQLSNMSPTAT